MKKLFYFLPVAFLLSFIPFHTHAATVSDRDVIAAINRVRRANKLIPLHLDYRLDRTTISRSRQVAANISTDKTTPTYVVWRLARKYGYRFRISGELLAADFATASEMVTAWMTSPSHRAIILNPKFRDIGVTSINVPAGNQFKTATVVLLGRKNGL